MMNSSPVGGSLLLNNFLIKSFLEVARGSIHASFAMKAKFCPKTDLMSVLNIVANVLTGPIGHLKRLFANFWNLDRISSLNPWCMEHMFSIKYVLAVLGRLYISLIDVFHRLKTFWVSFAVRS